MTLAIGIVGAGAIGSVIAARLLQNGGDVTVFARGARLAALRGNGLVLHGEGGTVCAMPRLGDEQDLAACDVLMLAVKAQHLPEAVRAYQAMLRPGGVVVPLVNGLPWWYPLGRPVTAATAPIQAVDPACMLRNAFDCESIIGTVVLIRASLEQDGAVRSAAGERIVLGGIASGTPRHLAALAGQLRQSGIDTRCTDAIRAELWTKIALNLATNPLSVVSGATLEEMFHRPELLRLVRAMLEETIGVATADGIAPSTDLAGMIRIGRNAGPVFTSMAQDYKAGRTLELAAIVDGVLDLAARHNRVLPVVAAVADLARARAATKAR